MHHDDAPAPAVESGSAVEAGPFRPVDEIQHDDSDDKRWATVEPAAADDVPELSEDEVESLDPEPATLAPPQVTVEACGVSDVAGELELSVSEGGPWPDATLEPRDGDAARDRYRVPVTTLDEYARQHAIERVRLVKCDVEGHELAVFRGGRVAATGRTAWPRRRSG